MQLRKISKYLHRDRTSKTIRQTFLDYFVKDNNHVYVRSSPVVPYCDPTVAFVNAGMNQFKSIFLGRQKAEHRRIANTQKCVRVGGKHNDLNVVGTDGYHHTFFEMLGNWSFGDYFKKDACNMAWNLLVKVYKLDKNRLYVTYFNGDKRLGLEPDIETYDIWRSIGVPKERLLPFGVTDNFWEMGLTGPCGCCTEIHYDRLGGNVAQRAKYVNKGLPDLVELWNVVFIEYNRNLDGSLSSLPVKHIDTGMGFERLTSIVQDVQSNYETDTFLTLFNAIEKICPNVGKYTNKYGENDWNLLDTNYRIMADHSRMIAICLADGMIPELNQKLRRVMRKSFVLSTNCFANDDLLKELTNYVADNLGPIYPELERNIKLVHQMIDYELNVYKSIRANALTVWDKYVLDDPRLNELDVIEMPGLVAAYKEIKETNLTSFNSEFSYKLYDTYGLDKKTISNLAKCLRIDFDTTGFDKEMNKLKINTKERSQFNNDYKSDDLNLMSTDKSHKYVYSYCIDDCSKYELPTLKVKILQIIKDGHFDEEITPNVEVDVVLDKTSLYEESGGQQSDIGKIRFDDGSFFDIHDVQTSRTSIIHRGILKTSKINSVKMTIDQIGSLEIDYGRRVGNTLNHTATHLLNATIKKIKGATCQKSSQITWKYFTFDLSIFDTNGAKLNVDELQQIEEHINTIIVRSIPIRKRIVNSQELLALDGLTLIPGEIYPDDGIRLIEINDTRNDFVSLEPCCGTHALNTKDICDFCVINVKSLGRSTTSLTCLTGDRATLARKNGEELLEHIDILNRSISDNIDKPEVLDMAVMSLRRRLNFNFEDDTMVIPFVVKTQSLEKLNDISRRIKEIARNNLKEFVEVEMQNAIQTKVSTSDSLKSYLVHYLRSSTILDSVPLQKVTRLCPNVPVLVISFTENSVKARCCVPIEYVNESFDAEKWLNVLNSIFDGQVSVPKGQDSRLVCNMKERRVNIIEWDVLLKDGLEVAHEYAKRHL